LRKTAEKRLSSKSGRKNSRANGAFNVVMARLLEAHDPADTSTTLSMGSALVPRERSRMPASPRRAARGVGPVSGGGPVKITNVWARSCQWLRDAQHILFTAISTAAYSGLE
jgi:hypothetical protein